MPLRLFFAPSFCWRSELSESESDLGGIVPFRGGGMMALILRPTGLGAGIDKDRRTSPSMRRMGGRPDL